MQELGWLLKWRMLHQAWQEGILYEETPERPQMQANTQGKLFKNLCDQTSEPQTLNLELTLTLHPPPP